MLDDYWNSLSNNVQKSFLRYLIFHDCGKTICAEIDAQGKRHFPNHAQHSHDLWLAITGNVFESDLMAHDMDIHHLKDLDLPCFALREDSLLLWLAGLSEIHANAAAFGGIESESFRIKFKQLEKRGKKLLACWAERLGYTPDSNGIYRYLNQQN